MIVLDSSALIEATVGGEARPGLLREIIGTELHVPHLLDYEYRNALRGMVLGAKISGKLAEAGLVFKKTMPIVRYTDEITGDRTWELRANFNPYDASYIALAERLGCPLVTTDAKMERGAQTIEVRLY